MIGKQAELKIRLKGEWPPTLKLRFGAAEMDASVIALRGCVKGRSECEIVGVELNWDSSLVEIELPLLNFQLPDRQFD